MFDVGKTAQGIYRKPVVQRVLAEQLPWNSCEKLWNLMSTGWVKRARVYTIGSIGLALLAVAK